MQRVSLRNVVAHKLRLALTVLTVVLGTSFIAGSFMFTNSLSNTFDQVLSTAFTGVDAAVSGTVDAPLDEQMRQRLLADDKVDRVNVASNQNVVVADSHLKAFQARSGQSMLMPYYPPEESVGPPNEIVDGRAPAESGEVLLNETAAEQFGVRIGDKLIVVNPDGRDDVTVVGIIQPTVVNGGIIVLSAADAFVERYGTPNQVTVGAADGTSADELVAHIERAFPELEVEAGEKLEERISGIISNALTFVNYFLIAFGLIALLVGTFIIANTFSMIVAQRTREFALLRALGASRVQITQSVVLEAFLVGLFGSALGVVAGMGLVVAIKAFLGTQGLDMGPGLGLSASSVIAPLVIGVVVTIISAWTPARRAGAVKPVEAMRSTEAAAGSSLKVRTVAGLTLMLAGAAAAAATLFVDFDTKPGAIVVGTGAFGVIVGFFLAGPALALPVVPALGRLIGAPFGSIGKLAATNSGRNPRRTAATAFALTLGVALVTAIGMLGATMKASVAETVESNISADFILTGPPGGQFPTPSETSERAAGVNGVDQVVSLELAPVAVDGQFAYSYGPQFQVTNLIDADPSKMIEFDMVEGTGSFEEGLIATAEYAEQQGWKLGQSLPVTQEGKLLGEAELKGIFAANHVFENMALVTDIVPEDIRNVAMVAVNGSGDSLREDLEKSVADLVVVQVMSGEEYAGQAASAINQMLAILYGLLALSVIIAVLGIINTLTLGVIERRQEVGMLRAVGTQRRQIKTMITLEAVQIAIFGALSGVLIGFGLGWSFIDVLADSGLQQATVPWDIIGIMLAGSGVVGVIAALWPASRAAKTPPLEAIAD
ncbi:FtsX-like permease family protein [Corynebacterium phocae]|nr:FtsX-like permease family protein [Corynebacterium phocae]